MVQIPRLEAYIKILKKEKQTEEIKKKFRVSRKTFDFNERKNF